MSMMLMVLMVLMNGEVPFEERMGSCHQCHQKRRGVAGSCVTMISPKQRCPLKFCPACLRGRYGEDAEEASSMTDWVCPRCRGICNCHQCRKNKGLEPTGKLSQEAKENGCSSAAELLAKTNDPNKYVYKRKVKVEDAGQEKPIEKSHDENHAGEGNSSNVARIAPVLEKKEIEEVKLPQGIESVTIFGIEFPSQDVGSVLQFLEFSSAFAKGLNLRERQAESVIRETFAGRSNRSPQHSTVTQTMIQLLTVIREDRGETLDCLSASDDSWFMALGECLAKSDIKLDDFPPEMFQEGIDAYENLDASKRINLLNFLCGEVLDTKLLRNIIKKESKENVKAAKEKNKQVDQKLKDPLAIVSSMSDESEKAFQELQEAIEIKKGDPTLRTSPVVGPDEDGLTLWKLNSYTEEPKYLLQVVGSSSESSPHGKWFSFTSQQKPEIEKYIAFKMMKQALEDEANVIIKKKEDDSD
ncbi:unnamed protein product [Microthlaspi erraticum]|uniref:DDT domain-containing protein n=1 Tax=Microthlaspi erraticum TaxID=1685480 RepID=A0A6D2L6L7_9BRAS|nr:unnamed protein product [Microthlaspi erraticum]